jgi:hypothetical protein
MPAPDAFALASTSKLPPATANISPQDSAASTSKEDALREKLLRSRNRNLKALEQLSNEPDQFISDTSIQAADFLTALHQELNNTAESPITVADSEEGIQERQSPKPKPQIKPNRKRKAEDQLTRAEVIPSDSEEEEVEFILEKPGESQLQGPPEPQELAWYMKKCKNAYHCSVKVCPYWHPGRAAYDSTSLAVKYAPCSFDPDCLSYGSSFVFSLLVLSRMRGCLYWHASPTTVMNDRYVDRNGRQMIEEGLSNQDWYIKRVVFRHLNLP